MRVLITCEESQAVCKAFRFLGHEATKSTCLWLKGLPLLSPTDIVSKGERVVFKSGKSHPAWYAEAFNKARTREDLSKMRSKTFEGIANAMAEQWGNL